MAKKKAKKKGTISMKCGEVVKELSIAHAEKILANKNSSSEWQINEDGYKIENGKIISAGDSGSDSGSTE